VTLEKGEHYGFYNERAEVSKDQISITTSMKKKVNGVYEEDSLESIAKDDAQLTPIRFRRTTKTKSQNTETEGKVSGGELTVVERGTSTSSPRPIVSLNSGSFFASFLPIWLGRHLSSMKETQTAYFSLIVETDPDLAYTPVPSYAQKLQADKYGVSTKTQRVLIKAGTIASTWWVRNAATPVLILWPTGKATVQLTTKDKAEQFLN
jgi:hypothetical protein